LYNCITSAITVNIQYVQTIVTGSYNRSVNMSMTTVHVHVGCQPEHCCDTLTVASNTYLHSTN